MEFEIAADHLLRVAEPGELNERLGFGKRIVGRRMAAGQFSITLGFDARLVRKALLSINLGEQKVRRAVLRIEPNRSFKRVLGRVEFVEGEIGFPELAVGARIMGSDLGSLQKIRDGFGGPVLL